MTRTDRARVALGSVLQDVRYGIRALRGHAGATIVAIVALALGLGVNTAVFTAYRAMVLRPLDARDPGRMVNLALTRDGGGTDFQFSGPDYDDYRRSLRSVDGLIASTQEQMTLSGTGAAVNQRDSVNDTLAGRLGLIQAATGHAEFASVALVSENYFAVLGVGASRGRTFDALTTDALAASPSVLVSQTYWARRFAPDVDPIGRSIHLNGASVTIVGVMPRGFIGTGVAEPNFWLPLSLEPLVHGDQTWLHDRDHEVFRLFGRLAPGVNIGQAQAEMSSVAARVLALHTPASASDPTGHVAALVWPGSPFPLPLKLYPGLTLTIVLVMAAAGLVLVVACANVASVQLARGGARQTEFMTRLSLGASRRRLIRQLVTESLLLGLVAGLIALACSWLVLTLAVRTLDAALPVEFGALVFDVAPDLEVLGFAFVLSLAAGTVFGLLPALSSSRAALASSSRGSTASARGRRLHHALLSAQVALSLVLMAAGSMLIRSAISSLRTSPGYDTTHVIAVTFQFPPVGHYTPARKLAFTEALRTRLEAMPDVMEVTSARTPDDNRVRTAAVAIDAIDQIHAVARGPNHAPAFLFYTYVQSNYFDVTSIPIVAGHGFGAPDEPATHVVISESTARALWPGQDPIGRRVRLGAIDEQLSLGKVLVATGPTCDVIGVARDIRGVNFDGSNAERIYLPLPTNRLDSRPMLVRTHTDAAPLTNAVDALASAIDPDVVATTSTLDDALRRSAPFVVSSLSAAVASSLGLLGLLLALMGIYGTVSYIVVQRTREVGIRVAVGAQPRDILGLILAQSTRPVVVGLAVGMGLAVGTSLLLHRLFYGLGAIDGVSVIGVALLFLVVAWLAALPPSTRALRVDPITALRPD